MAGKPLPDEELLKVLAAYERHGGKTHLAAQELGLIRETYNSRLQVARARFAGGTTAQKIVVASERASAPTVIVRPHFTVRQDNTSRAEKIRVICIGDAHDSPALTDKSRFKWIGKYCRQEKPDVVIQIGDFATLDSLNTHVPNETFQGKSKPTYMADMASFNEALTEMNLPDGQERHCTLGNHERRLYAFEDKAPEAYGMMQFELQSVFERHKWTFSPYGQITYYGGVGFVHAALNRLNKTYGGKNAEQTIANDSIHDLVIGHSHTERRHRAPKIGGNNYVQIINVGCALPDQHIEDYAQHALTGWSYGIADMTIKNGHVQDYHFVSMNRLGERYGAKAA